MSGRRVAPILSPAVQSAAQIPATDVRANWADLIARARVSGERIVVMNWGRPVAAIVPITDLETLYDVEAEESRVVHAEPPASLVFHPEANALRDLLAEKEKARKEA